MSNFYRVSYRWSLKMFFKNVRRIIRDLFWIGPRNLIRWAPIIWLDADFDWSYLADIMQYKLSRMAAEFDADAYHFNSQKDARRMRICAHLLKRLSEDNYGENASKAFGNNNKAWSQECNNVQNQDEELLFTIMRKHWRCWWI